MSVFERRTPAAPQDYQTTQERSALPPVEFMASPAGTFTIQDRLAPQGRYETASYRIYFVPVALVSPERIVFPSSRMAIAKTGSLVGEVPATGRGETIAFSNTTFAGKPGWFFCVGVNREGREALPEHFAGPF